MLSSIHPLGERSRNNSYALTVTWHVLGSMLAGAAMGALAGGVGAILAAALDPADTTIVWLACGGATVAVVGDLLGRVPSGSRQVDERWLTTYRSWVYAGGYGAQLGVGVATIVTTWAIPLTWWMALLTRHPAGGALVGGTYGLVRGATILAGRSIDSPAALRDAHLRLESAAPTARRATVGGLVVLTSALALVAVC